MDELKRILAFCLNACIAGALLRFFRSTKNGFCRSLHFFVHCCYRCYYRRSSYYYDRSRRFDRLQTLQAFRTVSKKRVAAFFLVGLLPFFIIQSAGAVTINTVKVGGRYVPLTSLGSNPTLGTAVEIGATALGVAYPWIGGITTAISLYRLLADLDTGSFAIRSLGVPEVVPTWPNNSPPLTSPPVQLPAERGYSNLGIGFYSSPDQYCALLQATSRNTYGIHWSCFNSQNVNVGGDLTPTCRVPLDYPSGGGIVGYTVSGSSFECNTFTGCPYGYTAVNTTTCNLTDPSKVKYPSDGTPTYVNDGAGHFVLDPRDPDPLPTGLSLPSSSVTIKSSDGLDSLTLTANTDGGVTTTTTHQYYNSTDASNHTFNQSLTTNNLGAVTSYSTSNNITNVTNGTVNSPSSTTFPNDYNRETTQTAIKDALTQDISAANAAKSALGNGPTGPTYASSELNLPSQDKFQVAPTSGFANFFPSNDGQCVTLSVNLPYFSGLVLDPCAVVTAVRPLVDWAVMALGLLSGVFVWFGKTSEV